jgi:hypothetical protein
LNGGGSGIQLLLLAAYQHYLGSVLGKTLGHPLPDAAASPGDECGLSREETIPKDAGHRSATLTHAFGSVEELVQPRDYRAGLEN